MVAKTAAKMMMPVKQGQAFKDRSKPADIRHSNINAAKGKQFKKPGVIFHKKSIITEFSLNSTRYYYNLLSSLF